MKQGDSSSTGIDKLLDAGKEGLNLFSTFIPRYKAWTGSNPAGGDEAALMARYDQQRSMHVEPLRTIGTVLAQELNGDIGDAIRIQQLRLGELPSRWSGSTGADNAAQMAQRVNAAVGKEHDNLTSIAQVLSTAAEQLENVVRTKADAVRTDFSTTTLAGKSADQVDRIIAYARGDFGGAADVDEQRAQVRDILPEIGSADGPAEYSKCWLDKVFVPALDGKISAFSGLTDATHTAVIGLYDQLGSALESLGASPYTGPDGQPSPATSLQSAESGDPSQALFSGMPVATPAALTHTLPLAATTPQAADGSDPSVSKPAVIPVSASTGDAQPHQGTPVAAAVPTAPADTGDGASKKTPPTQAGQGSPTQPGRATPNEPAKAPASGSDMGKVGEWRPGDIANVLTAASQITGKVPDLLTRIGDPLKAVGETAKDFGEAFKSVVGSDGITGLVKEGVDAAERIDKLVDHHTPGDAPEPSNPGQPGSNPSGPHDHGASKPPPAQVNPAGNGAPTEGAGHPTGTPQNGVLQNGVPAGNEGKSIPMPTTPGPTATPNSYSTAAATAPNTSASISPSGFFGGHGSAARSEGDGERRPKIQYVAPAVRDEGEFVDAAEGDRVSPQTDSSAMDPDALQGDENRSSAMASGIEVLDPEVRHA